MSYDKFKSLDDKTLKTPQHDKLLIHFWKCYSDYFHGLKDIDERNVSITLESPIKVGRYIIGYWDAVLEIRQPHQIIRLFIEVKPWVDNFGEVLRQLKKYRVFLSDQDKGIPIVNSVFLFSPDKDYDPIFESEDIRVIHPNGTYAVE